MFQYLVGHLFELPGIPTNFNMYTPMRPILNFLSCEVALDKLNKLTKMGRLTKLSKIKAMRLEKSMSVTCAKLAVSWCTECAARCVQTVATTKLITLVSFTRADCPADLENIMSPMCGHPLCETCFKFLHKKQLCPICGRFVDDGIKLYFTKVEKRLTLELENN